jgi:hypothetical protein
MRSLLALFAVNALFWVCSSCSRPSQRAAPDASRVAPSPARAEPARAPSAPHAASDAELGPRPALLELARTVSRKRLADDVSVFARARVPGSAGWREVQQRLQKRLTVLGFEFERQEYGSGVNLIGTLHGASRERVIVSAHYDHIAQCAGADDDASGLAAVLEVARLLAPRPRARTLVVAFWDEEERGLLGSRAFSARARERSENIVTALSLDAVGVARAAPGSQHVPPGFDQLLPAQAALLAQRGFRADFIALVANTNARPFADRLAAYAGPLDLPLLRLDVSALEAALLPDLFRSDHAAFWLAGYPGLLLTDTAEFRNPAYHCQHAPDVPQTLDYEFLTRVTGAVTAALAEELGPG